MAVTHLWIGQLLQERLGSLQRNREPFLQVHKAERMPGVNGLDERHFGLSIGLFETGAPVSVLDAFDERWCL